MTCDMISFDRDVMRVRFDRFDIPSYDLFLRVKRLPESTTIFNRDDESYTIEAPARFAPMLGVEVPQDLRADLALSPFLFDDQSHITRLFLDAKRFACWSGCGNGKTIIGLEGARHVLHRTNGRGLIVTRNEIVGQWIDEARTFYGDALPIERLESRAEMIEFMAGRRAGPALCVTNYEKWNPISREKQVISEARLLALIILDESNRLAMGGGKQKWSLIKSCRGIEYKLSLTATPAPNDTMEFASQASFLEKMRDEGEIIWTYFVRDPKTHRWTVKPHARAAFFRFMSSWSIYVNDPRRFGWRLDIPQPPAPETFVHEIEPTQEQMEELQSLPVDRSGQKLLVQDNLLNAIQRNKVSQFAKGFRYLKGESGKWKPVPSRKPAFVADLARQEVGLDLKVLVWCVYNAEAEILAAELAKQRFGRAVQIDVLGGDTDDDDRLAILDRFRRGESDVLLAKASMLGFGMNFQVCGSMIFSGFNDSYVAFFQAWHRAVRHGQTKRVRLHIPVIPELEGDMWDNLCRKDRQHHDSIDEMELNYIQAIQEAR